MQNDKKNRRFSMGWVAGISLFSLTLGAGAGWWALNSIFFPITNVTVESNNSTPNTPVAKPEYKAPEKQEKVKIYWLATKENKIELIPTQVEVQNKSQEKTDSLKTALNVLLNGPKEKDLSTTIPEGTKLLSLSVEKDGVHLNLSQEFTTGGGSDSMNTRLAQILYTATSFAPNTPVWISVEGKPIEVLGGEGIVVNQPMTRQDFTDNFPQN